MIGIVIIGATVAVAVLGVVLIVRRPLHVRRILRLSTLALTLAVAVALGPLTVADSGSAAIYLLGVPVVAAVVPVLGELTRSSIGPAPDAVAAIVMAAWGLLLGLGIGAAFLPAAILLLVTSVMGIAPGESRPA